MQDQRDANFLARIAEIDVIMWYDTGTKMSYMSYMCYVKLKGPPCRTDML